MAIAVVGMLAALVALSGGFTQPGGASAQDGPTSPFVPNTATPEPTAVPVTPTPVPLAPVAAIPTSTAQVEMGDTTTVNVEAYFTDADSASLTYMAVSTTAEATATVAAGTSMVTITGVAIGTGTVVVTATDEDNLTARHTISVRVIAPVVPPTPTPMPVASMDADDSIESSSTSASATVKLELTIGNLPMDMLGGSSIELYLEDDFDVPSSIDRGSVYFTVDNPPTAASGSGGRVYVTDPIEVDTDGHFTDDKDDYAIQVVLPDFNTADRPEFDGFNGPMARQTLKMVFTKGAGIKNPSEAGTHSVGYSVLSPNADPNDGPTHSTFGMGREQVSNLVVKPAPEKQPNGDDNRVASGDRATVGLKTLAKISLSDVDNSRGYNLVVTGSGFNNGTSAALHVLADPDTTDNLRAMVDAGGDMEALACRNIIQNGHRVGVATVGSDDKVAIEVEVTAPIFRPGNVNFICMVDGEGRSSSTDVEDFKLESSIRVSPADATVGDTITVFAQDYPTTGASFTELKIANQVVNADGVSTVRVNSDNIGSDGSATATFTLPGSVANSALEGTVRIDAKWGTTSEDAKITVTGSTLRLSQGEARANDSITITGEGFRAQSGVTIDPADVTMDGTPLLVDEDSLSNGKIDVSNSGQFVATIYLWASNRDDSNPALTSGTHTIKVRDSEGYTGSAKIIITEPGLTVAPETLGPRDYLTVTGVNWPVDNQDSRISVSNVKITIEDREYTVRPDAIGRFSVEHRVSRRIGIPSTNQIKAEYGTEIVKVGSFNVPAATISISPTQGQPGDDVSMSVTGMPVYTEVEEITIGGATVGGSLDLRTDRDGALTAKGVTIPGLDPGTYSVVMKVGSDANQTVAIGSIEVLLEEVAGARAVLPAALSELGDNLVAVFYFDNVSKEWSFFDPRPEFAELNTLDGLIQGQAYWILVGEAVSEVVLNDRTRNLTCSNGDCWNLQVW